ncbi:copper chaperone PCu(A)C [Congregibacter sp.]|uniref:copper chaperone PCu(A)C n=1 Tax=Congregibacter sp. TaxID=2744308 RepID=UPI003F6A596B
MIDVRVPLFVLFFIFGIPALAELPQLSDAWIRAMPPGQKMTAAYLRVHNLGDSPLSILDVSSTVGMASLHETRLEGGRSTMQAVDSLSVEAGSSVTMAPGGLHIMLMGLKSTPAEGDIVPICVRTSEGDVCTDAPVRRAAPDVPNNHDHH